MVTRRQAFRASTTPGTSPIRNAGRNSTNPETAPGSRPSGIVRNPTGHTNHALAVASVDANATLRVEIEAANQLDWQLNARIVDGSLDIVRIFCEGDSVHDADVPDWVRYVAGVIGERLDGGR